MKYILATLLLLLAPLCALAQPSTITVTGVLYKSTGAVCASCTVTISKARTSSSTLGSASVTVTADGAGAISFTAAQNSFATITGSFTRGKYHFASGVELYFPGQSAISFDSLQSSEDSLLALVTSTRSVSAKTASYTVLAADTGKLFTNTGAAGTVTFTLPTAVAGYSYSFYIDAAQTLTVTAGASTTIRSGSSVTASAGNITNNTQGNFIQITAISSTKWVAESIIGTWTFN